MKAFVDNEHGATAIEYALIAGIISIVAVASLQIIGTSIATMLAGVHF